MPEENIKDDMYFEFELTEEQKEKMSKQIEAQRNATGRQWLFLCDILLYGEDGMRPNPLLEGKLIIGDDANQIVNRVNEILDRASTTQHS